MSNKYAVLHTDYLQSKDQCSYLYRGVRGRVSPYSQSQGSGGYTFGLPGSRNPQIVDRLMSAHGHLLLVYFCEISPTSNHATLNVGIKMRPNICQSAPSVRLPPTTDLVHPRLRGDGGRFPRRSASEDMT